MKVLGKFLNLLFKLPDSLKKRLAGGEAPSIRGNTLDLDNFLLAASNAKGPQLNTMPPARARAVFRAMSQMIQGPVNKTVDIHALDIEGRAGKLASRLYTPERLMSQPSSRSGLIIYYHGGGNVIGDLDSYEALCADLAHLCQARVLAVDYRLAPEHKYPAAAEDAYAALCWAQQHADTLNIDASNIVLAGDSAGGYLCSVACLQAMSNHSPLPKAQVLIYPMCDISVKRESQQLFAEKFILTSAMMDYFIEHYIRDDTDKLEPLCSPLLASDAQLQQMPQTVITVAGFDPLYDEGMAYYEKLKALGVNIQVLQHNDLTHGFITMTGALKRGAEAKNEIIEATRKLLDA